MLSENTAKSSKEVHNIITAIENDINNAKDSMKHTGVVVSEQMKAVNDVKTNFHEITREINEIVDNISQLNQKLHLVVSRKDSVTTVINDIYINSTHISSSSEEIVAITEQQAAGIVELTKHTVELNTLSIELEENIMQFKL